MAKKRRKTLVVCLPCHQTIHDGHPSGYGASGWARRGSGDGTGTWAGVGGHHKTLGTFLQAFAKAPLIVRAVHELSGGGVVLPRNLAVIAENNGP